MDEAQARLLRDFLDWLCSVYRVEIDRSTTSILESYTAHCAAS